jgi:hypothetical protein
MKNREKAYYYNVIHINIIFVKYSDDFTVFYKIRV